MKEKEHHAQAFSFATVIDMHKEKEKPNGMSGCKVAERVNQEFTTVIHPRSITRYVVQNDKVGIAGPSQRGPLPGLMEKETLQSLAQAFETHVQLKQINEEPKKNKHVSLLQSVQQVMALYRAPGPRIPEQLHTKFAQLISNSRLPHQWRKGEQNRLLTST